MFIHHIGLDQPAAYEIKIEGRIHGGSFQDNGVADWFLGEVACSYETGSESQTITVLTGTVADQAALHGLLAHIRNLNLPLLYVDCLSAHLQDADSSAQAPIETEN